MNEDLSSLIASPGFDCPCGQHHAARLKALILESGALRRIPGLVASYRKKKVFILTDKNEYAAAGEALCAILRDTGIPYSLYIFPQDHLEPDEAAVGSAMMHFDTDCDLILGVGSGVVNDIGKILSHLTGRAYMIAATAPSMDGYASSTSSMIRDGLKVSLNSLCPACIIADLDVLCAAPDRLLQSGLGDMVAKYIALCEWRIAGELVGEHYCPSVAKMVMDAVNKCVANAPGLARREPEALRAVMEGLVVTGIAMSYVGISRPASGMEHYFSHIWDMRGLAFSAPTDTHGIQCGVGTLLSIRVYDAIHAMTPNREKALAYAAAFDREDWNHRLRTFIGPGAEAMIAGEKKEGKYDLAAHRLRLDRIISKWDAIQAIIAGTIPPYETVERALKIVGAPTLPAQLGLTGQEVKTAFLMTKDIRDKYIASRLLWDLGVLEETAENVL